LSDAYFDLQFSGQILEDCKAKRAVSANLAFNSAHLPLDLHPVNADRCLP
jgi:hypothetical protein